MKMLAPIGTGLHSNWCDVLQSVDEYWGGQEWNKGQPQTFSLNTNPSLNPTAWKYQNMDTESALRRAVWEEPYDDSVRLVYADWLMATGDPEKVRRGEFVQVQIRLSRMTEEEVVRPALELRERELLKGRLKAWRAEVPHGFRYREGRYERGFYKPSLEVDLEKFLAWPNRRFQKAPLWHIYDFSGDWNRNRVLWPRLGDMKHLWRLDPLKLQFRLGDSDMATLAEWPVLANVRGLNLAHNPIGVQGVKAIAGSPRVSGLERLSLKWCEIGPSGAAALANSSQLKRVSDLDLDNCKIGDMGALAIVNSPYFPCLRRLNLTANEITPDGVVALASHPGLRRIVRLGLSYNHVGDAGAVALAESPHLRHIHQMILQFPGHGLELSASMSFSRRSAVVLQGADIPIYGGDQTITNRGMHILRERFTEIRDDVQLRSL